MMRKLVNAIVAATCVTLAAASATAKERFDPGTRVLVTVNGASPAERYFVRSDDAEVVVLNLGAENLPKRQLINMAIDNPEWMAGTAKSAYKDNNVRIGPDGVFVKDMKVAELGQVVEHIARAKVTSIVKK